MNERLELRSRTDKFSRHCRKSHGNTRSLPVSMLTGCAYGNVYNFPAGFLFSLTASMPRTPAYYVRKCTAVKGINIPFVPSQLVAEYAECNEVKSISHRLTC